MGQGDWNDYVKCLVSLNNYFKAWPSSTCAHRRLI